MTRSAAVLLALIVLSVAGVSTGGGQFSKGVDVVRIDALVTRDRQPVRGLRAADFELRDNGVVQTVEYVGLDEVPLNVVLAFDVSQSVAGAPLDHLRRAGRAVLDVLKPGDRGGLVLFGSAVVPTRELTSQISDLRAALDSRAAAGQTSLVDAAFAGLMLGTSDSGRSLLLVFSDGSDTASWLTADAVIDAGRRGDVVTYGVMAGPTAQQSFLRNLASATGGDVIAIKSTTDLDAVFLRMLDEYRSRYLLGYTPRGVTKGGWHRIDLRVKGQSVSIKVRPGYQSGS